MQPHHEMAYSLNQELKVHDCHPSTLHTPSPLRPNQSGHHLPQHYYSQFQQQKELCHEYEHVYQLSQHPHQFQASQQEQPHYLGGNGHRYCEGLPYYYGVSNCRQPQEESTARVSFWEAFNTAVLSDAKGKHQQVNENEICSVSENFGELEALFILAQTGSNSALAVENSHAQCNVGLPLSECHRSNVSATATIGVDNVLTSEALFAEKALMKRARKKTRKTKQEEEMCLMTAFFKRLVKRVINQQEVLQNKFVEAIERMDRERTEREEAWRLQEIEIYEREAIAKAHELDLASRRHSSIISSIEKITGQSFNFVSGKTRDQ